jgi:uncharacterized protein with PIN domain
MKKNDSMSGSVYVSAKNHQFKSFTRCMTCNTDLLSKTKETIRDRVDPGIYNCFSEFFYCPACDKVFWKGSHFARMERIILDIINDKSEGDNQNPRR